MVAGTCWRGCYQCTSYRWAHNEETLWVQHVLRSRSRTHTHFSQTQTGTSRKLGWFWPTADADAIVYCFNVMSSSIWRGSENYLGWCPVWKDYGQYHSISDSSQFAISKNSSTWRFVLLNCLILQLLWKSHRHCTILSICKPPKALDVPCANICKVVDFVRGS